MPRQELPFRGFTYASVTLGSQPIRVDWQLLKFGHVEGDHIRVHELVEGEEEGEGLVAILRDYQAAQSKAVVLINTSETLALPESVGKKLKESVGYPVVVITRSSGDRLLECLCTQYGEEELDACLVVEDVEELQEDDNVLVSSSDTYHEPHRKKGKYQ